MPCGTMPERATPQGPRVRPSLRRCVESAPEHVDRLRREFPSVSFSSPDQAEADRELPDADVVFGWAVNKKNLATAGRLKWVHVSAAGVTPLLFPEMVASPIVITNGRGLHAASMAEHTIGVLLAFTRKLHLARRHAARAPLGSGGALRRRTRVRTARGDHARPDRSWLPSAARSPDGRARSACA